MQFLNSSLFTGTRCFCPNPCSRQLTSSVAYSMVSLWNSAANTCCAAPLGYTIRATAFSVWRPWLWAAAASNCLCSSYGPVSSKVGISKVLGFPTITAACPVPSDVWLMTSGSHLFTLPSRSSSLSHAVFSFFNFCCRRRTCCWSSAGISCRTSVIHLSILED